jgi:hypothetical protein
MSNKYIFPDNRTPATAHYGVKPGIKPSVKPSVKPGLNPSLKISLNPKAD